MNNYSQPQNSLASGFLSRLLIPQGATFITQLIIDLNVGIFVLMAVTNLGIYNFDIASLVHWGGNLRALTLGGDWWRLVTCMFVHGGIMHLFSNMVAFVFVGLILEPILGRGRFVLAYLLTGFGASIASLLWHNNTVSVGASGAIFGLYGVILALLFSNILPRILNKIFLVSAFVYIAYNLVKGATVGIDTAAHIGGLVSGCVVGFMFFQDAARSNVRK